MLWIPLRQRRRAVGGQGIHAGAMVDPISGHIGVVPGALAHRRDPRHDAWRHFRRKTDFACGAVIISAWWEPLDKLSENRLGEGFERNLMILH